MVSSVTSLPKSIPDQPAAGAPSDPTALLANQQTFLQLLVAQIKNQNPLNPTDGTQFVTQLAQFSQLEQLIAVRQDADALRDGLLAPSQPLQQPQS
jgi:flagellar basal-body rod modification protein FlgD